MTTQTVLGAALVIAFLASSGCSIIPSHLHSSASADAAKEARDAMVEYGKGSPKMYSAMLSNVDPLHRPHTAPAHVSVGRRGAALRQYRSCVTVLERDSRDRARIWAASCPTSPIRRRSCTGRRFHAAL